MTSSFLIIFAKVHNSYYINTWSETDFSRTILGPQKVIIHLKHIQRWALETFFCERCTFPKTLLPSFPIYQYFWYRTSSAIV